MRLQNPEQLASELETGIGIDGTYYEAIDSHLRLRLPVCGLASYALAKVLREDGHEVSVVHSRPNFAFDPQYTHIFPVIHDKTGDTIVDPTYSSTLNLAGLSAEGVVLGDADYFPEQKIAIFRPEDRWEIAGNLATTALSILSGAKSDDPYRRDPPMKGMAYTRMKEVFADIWDTENWQHFYPDPELRSKGRLVAKSISKDGVKFIA